MTLRPRSECFSFLYLLSLFDGFRRLPLTISPVFLRILHGTFIMPIQTRLFLNYNLGLTHRHMAKMTKSQIMSELAAKTGLSKKDTNMFVETLVNMALTQVKKNGEFVIPGIGKLVKVKRPARVGRNPATGESIKIAAKTVVKFRVAKAAKDSVL